MDETSTNSWSPHRAVCGEIEDKEVTDPDDEQLLRTATEESGTSALTATGQLTMNLDSNVSFTKVPC